MYCCVKFQLVSQLRLDHYVSYQNFQQKRLSVRFDIKLSELSKTEVVGL